MLLLVHIAARTDCWSMSQQEHAGAAAYLAPLLVSSCVCSFFVGVCGRGVLVCCAVLITTCCCSHDFLSQGLVVLPDPSASDRTPVDMAPLLRLQVGLLLLLNNTSSCGPLCS